MLEGVRDLAALSHYRFEKDFHAEDGGAGESGLRHGKNGETLVLKVPTGTSVRIIDAGGEAAEYEILKESERIAVLAGGAGGRGNARFKSSTHQNPFEHTDGRPGGAGDIVLTLKLIADAGLVGLPNAGKSSLLNALTHAQAKVGSYPFTTLEPNLGDFHGFILADIPGLIEGASKGRGLGLKFLKHIERTKIVVHLVSAEREDTLTAYREVRHELETFGHGLANKDELLVLSKTDLVSEGEARTRAKVLAEGAGREVLQLSTLDPGALKRLSDTLSRRLSELA